MENSPKISVIIPIWNMEKYLQKCLESIVSQTYRNLEIICINNGSTDDSAKILNEYAAKDNRIKIITQNHTSLGEARNRGLEEVSGEYVTFVDADDWLEESAYSQAIMPLLENDNIDTVIFATQPVIYKKDQLYFIDTNKKFSFDFSGEEPIDSWKLIKVPSAVWCKIFKTKIIKEHNIQFPENKYLEDKYFNLEYLLYCNKVFFINNKLYYYFLRNDSNLKSWCANDAKNLIQEHFHLIEFVYDRYKSKNRMEQIPLIIDDIAKTLPTNIILTKTDRNEIKKDLKFLAKKLNNLNLDFLQTIRKNKFYKFAWLHEPYLDFGNKFLGLNINYYDKKYSSILYLLGIKIKFQSKKNYLKKILNTVFSIKKDNNHKIINILGIKFKLKDTKERTELDKQFKAQIKVLKEFISTEIYSANIIRDLHSKTFPQFKNCHPDKDIVIVACGPSMAYYKPIKDAIHIGVNKAFKNENIKMDYIFIQDKLSIQNYIEELLAYPAKIFMGSYILNGISWLYKCKIPLKYMDYDNINYYYSDYGRNLLLPYLEYCSLMDFGSVAFPAAQFALYTNPKRLYIVGCDCSSGGYFDGSKNTNVKNHNLSYLIKDWQRFKLYAETYYPDVEIISINPVGLKGMFKDVYTQEYIDANPELFTDIGYEILEEQVNKDTMSCIK